MINREFKKQIIFRTANNVRNLLGDMYLTMSDEDFKKAIFFNLSEFLQDDVDIHILIDEVLQEKEIEIEEVQDPRQEAIIEGDYQGQIFIQNELIKLLQQKTRI